MDVILIGAGGHGRVVLDILRTARTHTPVGFLDADPSLVGQTVDGLPVLGQINLLPKLKAQRIKGAIVSIGDNAVRHSYAQKLLDHGFDLINAVHPASVVSPTVKLGRNIVVAAAAVVSTQTRLSDSVIINTSAVVDHECEIGEACHICPGAVLGGRVTVAEQALIGLGARVIQCLQIGARAIVGAGAVVIEDVPEDVTAVGVPARAVQRNRPMMATNR